MDIGRHSHRASTRLADMDQHDGSIVIPMWSCFKRFERQCCAIGLFGLAFSMFVDFCVHLGAVRFVLVLIFDVTLVMLVGVGQFDEFIKLLRPRRIASPFFLFGLGKQPSLGLHYGRCRWTM